METCDGCGKAAILCCMMCGTPYCGEKCFQEHKSSNVMIVAVGYRLANEKRPERLH